MTAREVAVGVHVVLSCGVVLAWIAALSAHVAPWRRHHAVLGRGFAWLVLSSSVLAVGLAADSHHRFGMLFALQPPLLALSAVAQFQRSRHAARVLGVAGLLVAAGVLNGFMGLLATRDFIDVVPFAAAALVSGALAADDLRLRRGAAWRAHGHRMLTAGWFYLAELGVFVFDPHPSVIAWALAAAVPAAAAWWMAAPTRRAAVGRAQASP